MQSWQRKEVNKISQSPLPQNSNARTLSRTKWSGEVLLEYTLACILLCNIWKAGRETTWGIARKSSRTKDLGVLPAINSSPTHNPQRNQTPEHFTTIAGSHHAPCCTCKHPNLHSQSEPKRKKEKKKTNSSSSHGSNQRPKRQKPTPSPNPGVPGLGRV